MPRFQRFRRSTSHDACAGGRARVRAHLECLNAGTVEPTPFPLIFHVVSGSKLVPTRFQFGTVRRIRIAGRRDPLDRHCLPGGNAGSVDLELALVRSNSVFRGRGGETFGDFRPAAGADRRPGRARARPAAARPGADPARSSSSAIAAVYGWSAGHVGRPMLEGCAQRLGFARFSGSARQPRRLRRPCLALPIGAAELDQAKAARRRPRPPLCPHSQLDLAPPRSRARVAGFCFGFPISGSRGVVAAGAKLATGPAGRGWGSEVGQGGNRSAGRGSGAFRGKALRRNSETTPEARRVN